LNHDIITKAALTRRLHWVNEIKKISGNFGADSARLTSGLHTEFDRKGVAPLLEHLRLCGAIPESYGHDSSEEKLYSKYTDSLLAYAFRHMGFKSLVVTERSDAADVECFCSSYSFVADAKAFRLSRTAKNQKDFKVQAMDGWKQGKPYAMVVSPIYQLPARVSQIYQQASARNICLFTYSHLSLILAYSEIEGKTKAMGLLHTLLKSVEAMQPSKDAPNYWLGINTTMLNFSKTIPDLWKREKMASLESISAAKSEALAYLAEERKRIAMMTREEAISELIKEHNLENRIKVVKNVSDNGIMEMIK
jgi:type II restriction enzyme